MQLVYGRYVGGNALQRAGVMLHVVAFALVRFAAMCIGVFVVAVIAVHFVATACAEHTLAVFGAGFATVMRYVESATDQNKIGGQCYADAMLQ